MAKYNTFIDAEIPLEEVKHNGTLSGIGQHLHLHCFLQLNQQL